MLWTDAYFVSEADMVILEPEVTAIAADNSPAIIIDGPGGLTQNVLTEASTYMMSQMQRFGGYLSSGLVSANHLAAVFNVGGPGVNRLRILPGQITPDDPYLPYLKQWVVARLLREFYRTAYARTTQDRFKLKMDQYEKDAKWLYWPSIYAMGVPVVFQPMPCPGAVGERAPGTWGQNNVGTVTQAGTTGGTWDVAITYLDQSRYLGPGRFQKANGESFVSARVTVTVAANDALTINIDSLNPPSDTNMYGGVDPANLAYAITNNLNATAWNIYVGLSGGTLYLQNPGNPIPISQTTFTFTTDPPILPIGSAGSPIPYPPDSGPTQLAGAYAADQGQYADAVYTLQQMIQRG
jgi:hypothetical protein